MIEVYSEIKNKRFLVTGGAGFIGSHLVDVLMQYGARSVLVIDNFITGKKENLIHHINDARFHFVEADLCHYEICEKYCRDVDVVFHQAALGSVPRSIENPLLTNQMNVTAHLNVLWACVKNNIPKVVYASSSSVYGDATGSERLENLVGQPLSPYAVSKRTNELYATVFARVYGLQVIGLRYFNVFGPRQDPESPYAAVIPLFINAMMHGKQPIIYGDGMQRRDFTYVDNVVYANLLAAFRTTSEHSWETFNIGTGTSITVQDLFITVRELLQANIEPIYQPPRAGDVPFSQANIQKAQQVLGYKPIVSFRDGLIKTIHAYKSVNT